jgi:hypothetical protein
MTKEMSDTHRKDMKSVSDERYNLTTNGSSYRPIHFDKINRFFNFINDVLGLQEHELTEIEELLNFEVHVGLHIKCVFK